jgi:hypothetical protein
LKRNFLPTNNSQNCSNKTSVCSIRSSFLIKRNQCGNIKSSIQSNNGIKNTIESCCILDDIDENNPKTLQFTYEQMIQHSFIPRTIYNEIVTEIEGRRKSTNQSSQLN